MMEAVITLVIVIYLAAGWYIADIVDTEDILLNTLIMLFWPLVAVLGLFAFIFWM